MSTAANIVERQSIFAKRYYAPSFYPILSIDIIPFPSFNNSDPGAYKTWNLDTNGNLRDWTGEDAIGPLVFRLFSSNDPPHIPHER